MSVTEDPTRVFASADQEWLPLPLVPKGEAWMKVIHADDLMAFFKALEGATAEEAQKLVEQLAAQSSTTT